MKITLPTGKAPLSDLALLLLILIGNAAFLHFNMFRCFNTLDMGGFLDASWRVYKGQKPYIDFIYYSGPVHLYMNAFFFKLFGFGKTAVWAHVVVVHSIVITFVFLLLRQYSSIGVTALASLLTTASFYWSVSHPWHDVSAHFWGSLSILVLVHHFLSRDKPQGWGPWCLAGLFSVLAFLVKTNLGAVYVIVIGLVLLSEFRSQPRALTGYLCGILLGAVIGLFLIKSPQQYIEQCFFWRQPLIKQRLSGLFPLKDWFVNYYWVTLSAVAAAVIFSRSFNRCRGMFLLLAGVTLAGIYATNTGGMIKPANNFLWGIQVVLAFLVITQIGQSLSKNISALIRNGLCVWAVILTIISVCYGVELKVWTYLLGKSDGDYALRSEPLKGWKFYKFQGEPLDYMTEFVKINVPAQDRILNLTDMYILNAMTDREGYKGVPFVFFKDTIPLPGPEIEYVRANILKDLPEWIIMDVNSFVSLGSYLGLYNELMYAYRPVVQWGVYVLIKRI